MATYLSHFGPAALRRFIRLVIQRALELRVQLQLVNGVKKAGGGDLAVFCLREATSGGRRSMACLPCAAPQQRSPCSTCEHIQIDS